jgi:hypothetical protein
VTHGSPRALLLPEQADDEPHAQEQHELIGTVDHGELSGLLQLAVPRGPGKTAGPAEFASLMDDLEKRVFGRLPDETWVYPGHGDDTTLGVERPHLREWRGRGW